MPAPSKTAVQSSSQSWRPVLVVFLVALGIRLIYLFTMRESIYFRFPIMDGRIHDEWAWALARGEESPWSPPFFRAPLYPYFLSLIYRLFGHSYTWARVIQMVLGSASAALVFTIARRIFGARTAWLAGLVAAGYWMFLYFEGELLIVSLIVLLNLAGLFLLLRALEVPAGRRFFLTGFLLGLSAIARPNILLFAAAVLIWLAVAYRKERARFVLRSTAFLALGVALPIAPVAIANTAAGDFVLVASQGGVNFYIGNNPESDATEAVVPGTRTDWWGGYDDTRLIAEEAMGRPLRPSEVSRYWYRRGLGFIGSQPGAAARLFLRKFYLFWNHREFGNNRDIYFVAEHSPLLRILSPIGFGAVATLGLLGMGLAWRRSSEARLLILFVIVYMASVVLFFVNARYRMPVVPVLIAFGAHAVFALWDRLRSGNARRIAGVAIPGLILAWTVHSNLHGLDKVNRAFGHYNLGLIYLEARDPDRAQEAFRTSLRFDPERRDAAYNLAVTLIEMNRYEEAEPVLVDITTRDPGDAEAYYALGNVRAALGNLAGAARDLTRAVLLHPYYYEAHHSLGVIQLRLDRIDAAEASFRRALEIHPRFAGACNNLGIVLGMKGDVEGARGAFERALRIDPAHAGARENLRKLSRGDQD